MKPVSALIAALMVAAILIGFAAYQLNHAEPRLSQATVLFDAPRSIADFELLDQSLSTRTIEDFKGRWNLLFFGFTHCPDICPTTLYELSRLLKGLKPDQRDSLQAWLVTVDPGRDTAPTLEQYLSHFDAAMRGLTGDPAQLATLASSLGVAYTRVEAEPDYTMEHTAALFLIDANGRYAGLMTAPHDWKLIEDDLRQLLR